MKVHANLFFSLLHLFGCLASRATTSHLEAEHLAFHGSYCVLFKE